MFGFFRKKRPEAGAPRQDDTPALSSGIKAQRDREFAERLQQRLTAVRPGSGMKVEPKFKGPANGTAEPKPGERRLNDVRDRPVPPTPAATANGVKPGSSTAPIATTAPDAVTVAPERPGPSPPPATTRPGAPTVAPVGATDPKPAMPLRAEPQRPMAPLTRVMRAAQFAADRHRSQRRKGASREPYINHLLEVAALLSEATDGQDMDLVIAGLLHDLVEEHGMGADDIASQFGPGVAALVFEVTEDKSLPPADRRRLQIVHAARRSPRARMLTISDLVSNLRSLRQSPPPDWPIERQRDYLDWAHSIVGESRGVSPPLEAAFDDVHKALLGQFETGGNARPHG
jgi:HD domain